MPERRYLVAGQPVSAEKVEASRRLRRDSTPAEVALWAGVRGRRLGGFKFRHQQLVPGFVVDFYCPEAGLVVELDGPVHDSQVAADAEREAALRGRGLRVIRFPNRRVEAELPAVLAEIEIACRAGAGRSAVEETSPPVPLSGAERG